MILGQYNNWIEETNRCTGAFKESHLVADTLPQDYTDISSIENWHRYGPNLIGSAFAFKDWKCLQREIKALVYDKTNNNIDANWNNLLPAEKMIACRYMLSKIPGSRFAATFPDSNERTNLAVEFD